MSAKVPRGWRTASFEETQRIYRRVRAAMPVHGISMGGDRALTIQAYLRKVSAAFHRELKRLKIFVEGA